MPVMHFFSLDITDTTNSLKLNSESIEINGETKNFYYLQTPPDIYASFIQQIDKEELDKVQKSWRGYSMATVSGCKSTFIKEVLRELKCQKITLSDEIDKISDLIGILSEMGKDDGGSFI